MATEPGVNHAAFSADELLAATGGRLTAPVSVTGVSADSRRVNPGELFVALSGDNFDAHAFVPQAFARGAAAALVSRPVTDAAGPLLVVDDTLRAFQELARFHRERFGLPVVALTGSNGKTSTKEMIAAVLEPLGPVHRTAGNLNNHVGVPLTLLGLEGGHRAAVIEMGMNHPGEIRRLAQLARPGTAVILNAGRAHLAGVGGREGVVAAKSEIAEGLTAADTLIFFGDDPALREKNQARPCRQVTFGLGPNVDLQASDIEEQGLEGVSFDARGFGRVSLRFPGRHSVLNALAALAVARVVGVPAEAAVSALAALTPVPGRLIVRRFPGLTVIDDTYNANPDSMRAALDILKETAHAGRRVAVLGEMLELGPATAALHREIGAAAAFVDHLYAIGPSAGETAAAAVAAGLDARAVTVAPDAESLIRAVRADLRDGDLVLVKGSRGMALERVVNALAAAPAGADAADPAASSGAVPNGGR